MIGVSASMQRLYSLIHQASNYAYPVLIAGEKGTGKKLAAQTIHSLSQRKDKAAAPVTAHPHSRASRDQITGRRRRVTAPGPRAGEAAAGAVPPGPGPAAAGLGPPAASRPGP